MALLLITRGKAPPRQQTACNSAAVPERDAIVDDSAARSAKVRREYAAHLDLVYGDTPRERLDLFLTADP